ncbi:hypothetical protein AMTRI_Chr09g17140 [Amborella trichopoda]
MLSPPFSQWTSPSTRNMSPKMKERERSPSYILLMQCNALIVCGGSRTRQVSPTALQLRGREMSNGWRVMENHKPWLAMVSIQFVFAGMTFISKAALDNGMNPFVFVVYRQGIAAVVLVLPACYFERTEAPPLSFKVFCKIFLLSLFGITLSQDLFYAALPYTSATFVTTTTNIIPVITLFTAILMRIESVNIWGMYGQAKVTGALISIMGAIVLCLYKGPPLKLFGWDGHVGHKESGGYSASLHVASEKGWTKASFLMLIAYTTWAVWLVMQAKFLKEYPARLHLTALQSLISSVQAVVVALAFDRNPCSWKLDWNLGLLSIIYCGVFVSGLSYWVQLWCTEKKGPVYIAFFSPLAILITAIISPFICPDLIHWGSVLGGLLMVGGLYLMLWAKKKEERRVECENKKHRLDEEAKKEEWGVDCDNGKHGLDDKMGSNIELV